MRPGRHGGGGGLPGVTVAGSGAGSLIQLSARRGQRRALVTAAEASGLDLPARPAWLRSPVATVLWAGPDQWLVRSYEPAERLLRQLAPLEAHGTLIDQSHARAALVISGPRARDTLAKGFEIDLHPRAFRPGDVALTPAAGIATLIWQIDDKPAYGILVPRGFASSFWHWLTESAAEFGLLVEAAEAA